MEVMGIIAAIVCFLTIFAAYYIGTKKSYEFAKIDNDNLLAEQEKLKQDNQYWQSLVESTHAEYNINKQRLQDLQDQATATMEAKKSQLDNEYSYKAQKLKEDFEFQRDTLQGRIDGLQTELATLQNTKAATIEAFQKEQAIQENQDNYRLNISKQEEEDISFLNSIVYRITKPRLIRMLIWQSYFQPIAKKKFPIILGSNQVCGIYKITHIGSQKCYIGRAVDMYKRWCDHCKCGLGIDTPAQNKLYEAMLEYGLQNFTFELLEACSEEELNEKEVYYIGLYNSVKFGYNSNKGNVNG